MDEHVSHEDIRGEDAEAGAPVARRDLIRAGLACLLATVPALPAACRPRVGRDAGPDQAEPAGGIVGRLRGAVPAALAASGTPGLALAAFTPAGIAAAGFGLLRAGADEPVREDSVFPAASLSKPAFAFLVMTLAQQRRVGRPAPFASFDLDAPIGSFGSLEEIVPRPFAIDDPRMRRVTPRMLLEHSHAIGWRWQPGPTDEARIGTTYMVGEPGRAFDYAPQGYACLQRIVERLAGKDLQTLARERLFGPFAMRRSSFLWQDRFAGRIASGHGRDGVAGARPGDDWERLSPAARRGQLDIGLGPATAMASLRTTAPDYARFARGLLLGLAGGGRSPLGPRWTREMLRPGIRVTDRIWWGAGWALLCGAGSDLIWHYGNLGDYQSFVFADPTARSGLVLLTNGARGLDACRTICGLLRPETGAIFDWLDSN